MAASPGMPEIEAAAHAAGADVPIGRLPEGCETVLGKWFGGAELSVGDRWSLCSVMGGAACHFARGNLWNR